MPIDIPKFPIDNFSIPTDTEWYFWNFKKLTETNKNPYENSEFLDEIKIKFPELIEWVNLFPFEKIINVKFNIQKDTVKSHIDFTNPKLNLDLYNNNKINEPCGYRVLISGNRKGSLYIEKNGKKYYPILPKTTDVYVLGQTNCLHGVDDEHDRRTMYLQFYINKYEHEDLLIRSFKKYRKYVILND